MFYGLERLFNIKRLVFGTNGLSTTVFGLNRQEWVPVTERLFRQKDHSVASLALLPDADGEVLLQSAQGTYKQVSGFLVWGQVLVLAAMILIMTSSALFALVWGARKLVGRLHGAGPLSVRVVPLVSAILLGAFWGTFLLAIAKGNLLALGVRSWLPVTIMVMSIAFAVTAVASVYVVYQARKAVMNRAAYWHSVLVAMAVAVAALYMWYWGWIGLRLWA